MTAKRFVDTTILLYAKDLSEAGKQPVAEGLMRELWASRTGRLSIQVLNEYFVNATQKLEPGLKPAQAWSDVEAPFEWEPQAMDERLLSRAFMVRDRYGLSWWDSLIVAAAIAAGCDEILTEDLSSGQVHDGITVVNPFI